MSGIGSPISIFDIQAQSVCVVGLVPMISAIEVKENDPVFLLLRFLVRWKEEQYCECLRMWKQRDISSAVRRTPIQY